MTMEYKTLDQNAPRSIYGGKAEGLSWLKSLGYNVPPAIFIPASYSNVGEGDLQPIFDSYFPSESMYAVRSSALMEDGAEHCFAGHFATFTGLKSFHEVLEKIKAVKVSGTSGANEMGVVIQQYIMAAYSGVAFSSDPNTASVESGIISFVDGNGEALVSGKVAGIDAKVSYQSQGIEFSLDSMVVPELEEQLIEIAALAKKLEANAGHPVDIEWCIEKGSNQLFLLQCRPITTARFAKSEVIEVIAANLERIPSEVRGNDKIKLRLACSEAGIATTKAFILKLNRADADQFFENMEFVIPIPFNSLNDGYSSILIAPRNLNGNVIREFSSNDHHEVRSNIRQIFQRCFSQYWRGIVITHELFPLDYMGMIRRIGDGYLVELSKGGFIQKGLTDCSRFILDSKGEVVSKEEQIQASTFEIGSHGVEKMPLNELVTLPATALAMIKRTFGDFLADEKRVVEFGINQVGTEYHPYLIDFQSEAAGIDLTTIERGVISKGKISGRLRWLDLDSDWKKGVDMHFHDTQSGSSASPVADPTIFVADRPDISILGLLNQHDPSSIGFIFRGGSMLSHLCIVLREKGIPAIFLREGMDLEGIEWYSLEA